MKKIAFTLLISLGTITNVFAQCPMCKTAVESGMDEYSWKINTSTLPNGMYILNVFNDDEQLIYKIMKQYIIVFKISLPS